MWNNTTIISLSTLLLLQGNFAFAYGQDWCIFHDGKSECLKVDQKCRTDTISGQTLESCKEQAIAAGQTGLKTAIGGRSLIHEDSVYFLAQLLGFSAWQAYELLQYNAIPDTTVYAPFTQAGQAILTDNQLAFCQTNWRIGMPENCLLASPVLNGFSRADSLSGGMWVHLQLPYLPEKTPGQENNEEKIKYTYPDTSYINGPLAQLNPTLNNFKAWAFGKRQDACVLGITQNMTLPSATTSPCKNTGVFTVQINETGNPNSTQVTTYKTPVGEYVLMRKTTNEVYAKANDESLKKLIDPQDIKMAKLGMYTHILGDRYSHHVCSDSSFFSSQKNGDYQGTFNVKDCAQGLHFWHHILEQGANQPALQDKNDVTMAPGLSAIFDEILAFAQQNSIKIKPIDKNKVIQDLIKVLEMPNVDSRLNAMVQLEEDNGVMALPGHGSYRNKSMHQWLVDAGAPLDKVKPTSIDDAMKTASKTSLVVKPEIGIR